MNTKSKTFFILLIMILGGAFSASLAEGKGTGSVSVAPQPAGDTVRMGLKQCVDYALEHSYKMMIQRLANEDRRLDERDAYLGFLPSISASIGGQASFGRNIDPETNIYTTTTSFSNSYGVSGGMYVFNGFKIVNNYKIAKTARALGYEETQQLKDEIALAVIQAYYNVLYNEKMLSLTSSQLEASQANLELVTKEYGMGRKSLADKADIEAEVAEYSFNLVRQRNALNEEVNDRQNRIEALSSELEAVSQNNSHQTSHLDAESMFDIDEHPLSEKDRDFIIRFKALITANLSNSDMNIDRISEEMGLSRVQFYRILKRLTDLSPNEFIRIYRLKRARYLLLTTDMTISEICYETGFNTTSYFTRCFKEYFKKLPSDYSRMRD